MKNPYASLFYFLTLIYFALAGGRRTMGTGQNNRTGEGSGMAGTYESRIKRVTAFLELRLSQMHSYHDHKENMAHAAILVALGFVGAISSINDWPPSWVPQVGGSHAIVASILSMTAWFLIHIYLRWQLRNRRIAARYVSCFLKILRTWADAPPKADELAPYKISPEPSNCCAKFHTCIDHLVPRKWAIVSTDEGLQGYPHAVVNEFANTGTGAWFAENLVSYGNIALGLVLLIKTCNS